METMKEFQLAQKLLGLRIGDRGFDRLLSKVRILSADKNGLLAEMKVEDEHCGAQRSFMHGAFSTLLVDSISGVALMAANPHFQNPGVSLNINMTYMKAAHVGEDVLIKATNDKVGSQVAFLSVEILNKASNELLAKGTHVKYVGKAGPPKS